MNQAGNRKEETHSEQCHNLVTVLAALLVMSSHSLSELFCARFADEETKAWRIVLHGHGRAANRSWEL